MQGMNKLKFKTVTNEPRYSGDFSLPDFLRDENGRFSREKTLEVIVKEEYGVIGESDKREITVSTEDITDRNADLYNGYLVCFKASHDKIKFTLARGKKSASFIVDIFVPHKVENPNFIVQLDFVSGAPTKYLPIEELIDRGVAIAHVNYDEITKDNADFTDGVASLFDRNLPYSPGKIAIWAYCASLIGEYLIGCGLADKTRLYVAGHSRLGKTALLTGALYDIFAGCFVNCSGCSGAAISREKQGETVQKINEVFGYWFCPNYAKYNGKENEMPFDQHYLLSSVFPRKAFIVAASEDDWADTYAQYLCAEAASAAYEESGKTGLARLPEKPLTGEKNDEGNIKFFIRRGAHFFSREDWNFYIDCLEKDGSKRN